jgi:hypothetical protein
MTVRFMVTGVPAEARLLGTALQAKARKRPATIEGAWEAQASPWVSQPLEPLSGTGANNASLRTVSLDRAAGRALPLRGRCLQHFRQPHLGHVREGHPEQRADTLCDRRWLGCARQPHSQLPTSLERCEDFQDMPMQRDFPSCSFRSMPVCR